MDWKRQLRRDGFLEIDGFRIELSLDNTFMDLEYIPRIIVYDYENGKWHVLRNPIEGSSSFEELWDNAVETLERIVNGEEEPIFGDEEVGKRFIKSLKALGD